MVDFAAINDRTKRKRAISRITAMVPRLASEHDGEVIATVRAIERTLRGADMDWNDFAQLFSAEPVRSYEPAPPRPPSPTYDNPYQRRNGPDPDAHHVHDLASDNVKFAAMTAWEQTFVNSMIAQLGSGRWMTDKQRTTLKRIVKKMHEPSTVDWGLPDDD